VKDNNKTNGCPFGQPFVLLLYIVACNYNLWFVAARINILKAECDLSLLATQQ
jgi:hypothetical protein